MGMDTLYKTNLNLTFLPIKKKKKKTLSKISCQIIELISPNSPGLIHM